MDSSCLLRKGAEFGWPLDFPFVVSLALMFFVGESGFGIFGDSGPGPEKCQARMPRNRIARDPELILSEIR